MSILVDKDSKVVVQGITIPALYAVSNENLILRTVLSTIRQEMFRRGWFWEKKFRHKCDACETEFQHDVETCEVTIPGSTF